MNGGQNAGSGSGGFGNTTFGTRRISMRICGIVGSTRSSMGWSTTRWIGHIRPFTAIPGFPTMHTSDRGCRVRVYTRRSHGDGCVGVVALSVVGGEGSRKRSAWVYVGWR